MDPVTLIAPDGAEYTTRDPVEYNNLIYGHGYRPKPEPVTESVQPPPQSGTGSGKDKWAEYADTVGVTVEPDATRDDMISALRDAGKPVE